MGAGIGRPGDPLRKAFECADHGLGADPGRQRSRRIQMPTDRVNVLGEASTRPRDTPPVGQLQILTVQATTARSTGFGPPSSICPPPSAALAPAALPVLKRIAAYLDSGQALR
jgi:hypothetical protein